MKDSSAGNVCCGPRADSRESMTQTVRTFYDRAAEGEGPYHESTEKFSPSAPTEQIIRRCGEHAAQRVIDLGCGTGSTLLRLVQEYPLGTDYIGVDFSPNMIQRAQCALVALSSVGERNVRFLSADISTLGFPDQFFDCVYSECVLNLVANRERAIREIARMTAPGGLLMYSDFMSWEPVPESIRNNIDLISGCRAGSVPLSANVALLEQYGFVEIECLNYSADKVKRFHELMATSPNVRREFEQLQSAQPAAARFLDTRVGYYLMIALRANA